MQSTLKIQDRQIGKGYPVYIIAEMSANHNQNIDQAFAIVRAAHAAGADAVKLQTYTADTLTLDVKSSVFQIGHGTLWQGKYLHDLYAEAYTPWDWQPKLMRLAADLGMHCFSSPFDFSAVDFLEEMNVSAYKIASFELVDLPLIQRVARTGKPTIMSTGMASEAEIAEAIAAFRTAGGKELALLKCTSAYPSPPGEMNLRTIPDLETKFGGPVGLSDHTLGIVAPVVAVTLGAVIIEKHLTLSRQDPGPDSAFSLEPEEFKAMVHAVRMAEQSVGQVSYTVTEKEKASLAFRRSLFVVKDIKAGEPFTLENIRSIRPGNGLAPKFIDQVVGRTAMRDLPRGTPLQWDCLNA